jgi:hypothetical protein
VIQVFVGLGLDDQDTAPKPIVACNDRIVEIPGEPIRHFPGAIATRNGQPPQMRSRLVARKSKAGAEAGTGRIKITGPFGVSV